MSLEPLKITRRWATGNSNEVEDWDAIRDPLLAYALRTNQNLKQLGLDINGATYDFNNVGRATQTSSIVGRLDALELQQSGPGTRNLGFAFDTVSTVTIAAADTSALSSTNIGYVGITSTADATTADAGEIKVLELTANLSTSLIGCHWGLGTKGDFSDIPLWIYLIDVSGTAVLGVSMEGGKRYAVASDCFTTLTSVVSREDMAVSSAVSADANLMEVGCVFADFDDTGNALGEDYWTIQRAVGDIHFGASRHLKEGVFYF